jgi:ABC-type dipeptide/oligopeptide/nickel transport system permease component
MLRFVGRRLAWSVVAVVVIATVTFALLRVVPTDPAAFIAGQNATQETVDRIRAQYGLDQPLTAQYGDYMTGLVQGDLGESLRTREPVASDVARYLPATLELLFFSFAVYLPLSVALGFLAATRRGGRLDRLIQVATTSSTAIPVFWLAILLQFVFFYKLGWLPLEGRTSITATPPPLVTGLYSVDSLLAGRFDLFVDVIQHLVLPVCAVVLSLLAVGTRLVRGIAVQELAEPYVRTARGKGLRSRSILLKHVLRNALSPILTVTGTQFGYMVSWVIIIEAVFNFPGIGLYAFKSLEVFDYAPLMALTLISTLVFITINLVTDLLYPVLDPRVKHA